MLVTDQTIGKILKDLKGLNKEQLTWISGYIMGLNGDPISQESHLNQQPQSRVPLTLLYGSQTANAKKLAEKYYQKAKEEGIDVKLENMLTYKTQQLKKEKNLFIIISTHGEGEPPDEAKKFYNFILSNRVSQLDQLHYTVLALGDTSYEFFCRTGKDIDNRLSVLKAKQIIERQDCDLDYQKLADEWFHLALSKINTNTITTSNELFDDIVSSVESSNYTQFQPFTAKILENICLTEKEQMKQVRHLEITIEDSNIQYYPGDSIGVLPKNHPQLVNEIIQYFKCQNEDEIEYKEEKDSIFNILTNKVEITTLQMNLIQRFIEITGSYSLKLLHSARDKSYLQSYVESNDVLDLVQDYGKNKVTIEDFISILPALKPRYYSIASSLQAHEDEVHITLSYEKFFRNHRERQGSCSSYLSLLNEGDSLQVFVKSNLGFALTKNPDKDIIMIGAGTGIAPYRAFMEEREQRGDQGKNWLIFGEKTFKNDFLYQSEWQEWKNKNLLTQVILAFSRDQNEKIYVQDRIKENIDAIYEWIQNGAIIYLCGDKEKLGNSIFQLIKDMFVQKENLDEEQADERMNLLIENKQYQLDIY